MVELRGHGLLGDGAVRGGVLAGPRARSARRPTVAGHAVRQLYLDCGAVDVAVELGDQALLDAVLRRWHDMVATRMYLTGGHRQPPHATRRSATRSSCRPTGAYAETCAAIASVMLAWRLLLATGEPRLCRRHRADDATTACCSGVSLDGDRFFYVNPLQRRTNGAADSAADGRRPRQPWYAVRLLPAERDAHAQLVAAVPRDDRRRRASRSTSTRPARSSRRRGRRRGPTRGRRPATRGAARSR